MKTQIPGTTFLGYFIRFPVGCQDIQFNKYPQEILMHFILGSYFDSNKVRD